MRQLRLAGLWNSYVGHRVRVGYAAHLTRTKSPATRKRARSILQELHRQDNADGAVLQQLCKLLYLDGDVDGAERLLPARIADIHPDQFRQPIQVELAMARREWELAVRIVRDVPPDDVHLVGLKKKVYVRWAASADDRSRRIGIAREGLSVPMDERFMTSLPILVQSIRLAEHAEDDELALEYIRRLDEVNPSVTDSLRSQAPDTDAIGYWEEGDLPDW